LRSLRERVRDGGSESSESAKVVTRWMISLDGVGVLAAISGELPSRGGGV